MEFTWITGSVAWFYNVLTKEMIGIKPDFDQLVIDPKLPAEWNEVSVTRIFREKSFDIKIQRSNVAEISIELNGTAIKGNQIKLTDCQLRNTVNVLIP